MIDSDFWRELAAEFSARSTPHANLHAAWQYTLKSGTVGDWRVNGDPTQRGEFEALARRAAIRLSNKRSPDLLITWLEALREDGFGFRLMGHTAAEVGPNYMIGSIDRLCEASAHLCRKLESAALQAEYEGRQRSERTAPEPQPTPVATKPETIGEQIRRLREECHLSTEELAEEVALDPRTVQRHEAGDMKPQPRRIRAYERIFSKLLKRNIVIRQTP